MTKILKDSTYNELKAKADGYDAIVSSVSGDANSDSHSIEETTSAIIDALNEDGDSNENSQNTELETRNTELEARVTELETKLKTANDRVAELEQDLEDTPAEQPAAISAKGEPGGEDMDIAKYALKHKGDTAAILAQAQKEGLI